MVGGTEEMLQLMKGLVIALDIMTRRRALAAAAAAARGNVYTQLN